VQEGDLVVEVNGREVKSVEDVHDTLAARKQGEDVTVTVVDESGARRALTWRASSERRL
jgi:S1-C subfamily serine protease